MPGCESEYNWKHHQDVFNHKVDKLMKRYPNLSRKEAKYIVNKKMR